MSSEPASEFYLWTLFQQLVRRGFAIGLEEYAAVMQALRAGFGWHSRDDLKRVVSALWATSREEAAVVASLFDQSGIADWNIDTAVLPVTEAQGSTLSQGTSEEGQGQQNTATVTPEVTPSAPLPTVTPAASMPPLRPDEVPRLPYSHVFLPQYPVSYRHVAQTWRRLRWPLREGPPVELDVDATVAKRSRRGVVSPPVLRPRRRNQAHLLLLVDRKGSMAPFHGYVSEVCTAIAEAGRLGHVGTYFFHDTPLEGADLNLLGALEGQPAPHLDPILAEVPPLMHGDFYRDPQLLDPHPAETVLRQWHSDTAIVIISDGGAARGNFDVVRLLDTIASLKGLLGVSTRVVWLNPVPQGSWRRSTAAQIARHVPMFPMDRDGMHRAVSVLRGQPFALQRPLPRSRPCATVGVSS